VIGQDGLLAKDGKIIVRKNRTTKQTRPGGKPLERVFLWAMRGNNNQIRKEVYEDYLIDQIDNHARTKLERFFRKPKTKDKADAGKHDRPNND
jgi:hypothetical protein